ncbi:MAG TPA: MgtC/SapB family protein [Thermoflexia bacterium]|nr:MgtC/SapB family protein [Thermoflexia bacterium]
MPPISELELVGRLLLAVFLGFLIGLERELAGQPAGERTHALASLGAAIFALVSLMGFPEPDPARVAAGVVTGLGFLGAGMILKEKGREVHGLTTAAGIWAVGGIGLAVGAGLYLLGIAGAVLVGLVLGLERWLRIDERLAGRRRRKDE